MLCTLVILVYNFLDYFCLFLPALYIGLAIAHFQSFGTRPCFKDALNSKVKAGEISSPTSFKNLHEMSSGHNKCNEMKSTKVPRVRAPAYIKGLRGLIFGEACIKGLRGLIFGDAYIKGLRGI